MWVSLLEKENGVENGVERERGRRENEYISMTLEINSQIQLVLGMNPHIGKDQRTKDTMMPIVTMWHFIFTILMFCVKVLTFNIRSTPSEKAVQYHLLDNLMPSVSSFTYILLLQK